jgi:MerR family transcriptional regulator, light-induced transcriptional regulator
MTRGEGVACFSLEHSRDEFHKRLMADSLSEQFGLALLAGDAGAAEEVALEALEMRLGEAMLYDLVVGPAMHRIGRLWASGEIGVGHEHLATQIATRVLVLAHEATGIAAERGEHRAMLAAVEGEQHVVALDMGAKLLESAGYEVLTLGADLPTGDLPTIISDYSPALFALSATMPAAGDRLPAAIDAIIEADADIGVIIGGASTPPRLLPDPRVVVERTVAGIVATADRLVRRAGLN